MKHEDEQRRIKKKQKKKMPKYNYFTCTLFIFFIDCNKHIL